MAPHRENIKALKIQERERESEKEKDREKMDRKEGGQEKGKWRRRRWNE